MEKILEEFRCFLITSKWNILSSKNIFFQGFKTYFDFVLYNFFAVFPEWIQVQE